MFVAGRSNKLGAEVPCPAGDKILFSTVSQERRDDRMKLFHSFRNIYRLEQLEAAENDEGGLQSGYEGMFLSLSGGAGGLSRNWEFMSFNYAIVPLGKYPAMRYLSARPGRLMSTQYIAHTHQAIETTASDPSGSTPRQ